jgi:hypothetical protein
LLSAALPAETTTALVFSSRAGMVVEEAMAGRVEEDFGGGERGEWNFGCRSWAFICKKDGKITTFFLWITLSHWSKMQRCVTSTVYRPAISRFLWIWLCPALSNIIIDSNWEW